MKKVKNCEIIAIEQTIKSIIPQSKINEIKEEENVYRTYYRFNVLVQEKDHKKLADYLMKVHEEICSKIKPEIEYGIYLQENCLL